MISERIGADDARLAWYRKWSEANPDKAWREVELCQRLVELHEMEPFPVDEIKKIQTEIAGLGGWESWNAEEEI